MNIDSWLRSKITNSTLINVYTTRCYPIYVPSTAITPYLWYDETGWDKNRNERNVKFTIVSCHNSKANVEILNDALYTLFDNSTRKIQETSSNLRIESVEIINNSKSDYDDSNKNWYKAMDISVWYF